MSKNEMEFEIKDYTPEVLKAKDEAVKVALVDIGLMMEGYAQESTPIKTGRLRNSILYATKTSHGKGSEKYPDDSRLKAKPEKNSVYVGTNVEYGPAIEFGSKGRTARHMLKNSVQNHLQEYSNILKEWLG